MRRIPALAASAMLAGTAAGQFVEPPIELPPIEVITREVGKVTELTQGVVYVHTTDSFLCTECDKVEKFIFERPDPTTPSFAERMNEEGIVFREIRNQFQYPGNPNSPRVNEHLEESSPYFNKRNVLPSISIEDTGRSFKGDKAEVAIRYIKKVDGLEKDIRRYALDDPNVSFLEGNQAISILEAIASNLFEINFGTMDDYRIGFIASAINCADPHTIQTAARLQANGPGIQMYECHSETQQSFPKVCPPATLEEARVMQLDREILLPEGLRPVAKNLTDFLQKGGIYFPWELRNTRAAHFYQQLAHSTGRAFIFERRVPTEREVGRIPYMAGFSQYAEQEIARLKRQVFELDGYYGKLAAAGVWYVPANVDVPLPEFLKDAPLIFEDRLGDLDMDNLLKTAIQRRVVQVDVPNNLVGCPQTYGSSYRFYEKIPK